MESTVPWIELAYEKLKLRNYKQAYEKLAYLQLSFCILLLLTQPHQLQHQHILVTLKPFNFSFQPNFSNLHTWPCRALLTLRLLLLLWWLLGMCCRFTTMYPSQQVSSASQESLICKLPTIWVHLSKALDHNKTQEIYSI